MIGRLLIANRGEIAVRIARTARRMGVATVAVHSDADAAACHVLACDEALRIGPAPVSESYLDARAILEAARAAGADAIHPGYGFLSENPDFAGAVEAAGLIWVGPPAAAIRAMGLKDSAKRLMEEAGVPVTPGYHGETQDPDFLAERAAEIGYPVLIKAAAGGGGKGMRRVDAPEGFAEALARARSEAESSFGNPHMLIEKFIDTPRHIEVQVFADSHGNMVHLYERDCSAQRRHQKVIEEAPAPGMTPELRSAMTDAAVRAAEAVGYRGAGTVEFIVDGRRMSPDAFFFMEMNTRLQVEHPVTEAVTGLDLVEWQLRVASGEPLPLGQEAIGLSGHAVEARLYAEDPAREFFPQTGRIAALRFPEDVRVDSGVGPGDAITPHYDPMIAKLVAHGPDRAAAFDRLRRALVRSHIAGLVTNLDFLERLLADADMAAGRLDTGLIGRRIERLTAPGASGPADLAIAAAALDAVLDPPPLAGWRNWGRAVSHAVVLHGADRMTVDYTLERAAEGAIALSAATPDGRAEVTLCRSGPADWQIETDGRRRGLTIHLDALGVTLVRDGQRLRLRREDPIASAEATGDTGDSVTAPLPGLVRSISVEAGVEVAAGEVLAVMEAMKMEHSLTAPRAGRIAEIRAAPGEQVAEGAVLIALEAV